MDSQDRQDRNRLHEDFTRKVIGCAFEVIDELGSGFLESVYEKALCLALTQAGLSVEYQKQIEVTFRSKNVGTFYADLLVEEKVLIELRSSTT